MFLSLVLSVILVTGLASTAYAQSDNIPEWVKGISGFWSEGKISDSDFINAIEFLINQDIIKLDNPTNAVDTDKDAKIISLEAKISDLERDIKSYLEQIEQYKNKQSIEPSTVITKESTENTQFDPKLVEELKTALISEQEFVTGFTNACNMVTSNLHYNALHEALNKDRTVSVRQAITELIFGIENTDYNKHSIIGPMTKKLSKTNIELDQCISTKHSKYGSKPNHEISINSNKDIRSNLESITKSNDCNQIMSLTDNDIENTTYEQELRLTILAPACISITGIDMTDINRNQDWIETHLFKFDIYNSAMTAGGSDIFYHDKRVLDDPYVEQLLATITGVELTYDTISTHCNNIKSYNNAVRIKSIISDTSDIIIRAMVQAGIEKNGLESKGYDTESGMIEYRYSGISTMTEIAYYCSGEVFDEYGIDIHQPLSDAVERAKERSK